MELYEHPHTIENGGGEELTFTGVKHDERGPVLLATNEVAPGAGPPMHVHKRQHEALTVSEGRIGWKGEDGAEHFAGPGETVTFEPGQAHRFWNAGEETLRATGEIWPPDNIEYFLSEVFGSMERNGGERPGMFDVSFLLTRYSSEFDMVELPTPVRTLLVPVLYRLGGLLGKHKRFEGAPEPVAA
jgi:quercetin dioxygenase-like cupin family protein